jgi:2-oxoisovalerate dehydrogenase E1 component
VGRVRQGKPFLQIVETRRLLAHSKGDDDRPREVLGSLWESDPLSRLVEENPSLGEIQRNEEEALDRVCRAVANRPVLQAAAYSALPPADQVFPSTRIHADLPERASDGRVAEELNRALHEIMGKNKDVILIGEDLLDPYGGAFKVSRGLSTKFPGQVLSTPIAEAGLVGVANGVALTGMRPVAEIMFADFVTLAADQLINFAAKFHSMYGGKVRCPLTLRLVSGAGRGYGPTHSQSLEHLFCGVPGLRVVALSQRHDPGQLLRHAVLEDDSPKVLVENKLLYALRPAGRPPLDLRPVPRRTHNGDYPALCYEPEGGADADVTVVTYGGMTGVAEGAMHKLLEEEELRFDYFILTQLWPLDVGDIVRSVTRTKRLLVVEENVPDFSVGAAVIAAVAQRIPGGLACRAVGSRPVPFPCARHLENEVLPSVDRVVGAVLEILPRAQR